MAAASSHIDSPFGDFLSRYTVLQRQQHASDKLIEDLLIYCQGVESTLRKENDQLSRALYNAQLDYDDAKNSRRELQLRIADYEDKVAEREVQINAMQNDIEDLKNRNPYVLVLIDGDGLIFQDQYIKQGLEGGKKAAYALRAAVADHCKNQADGMEIVARIVANVSGLSKALCRHGSLENNNDLREFALGFTQAKSSFDFIDVGYGKERADSKIKETTHWHLRNHNCKQILLGISHDAGYAPFLDEILQDNSSRQRVTVIEGVPTVHELSNTNVNILDFGSELFRCDKIDQKKHSFTWPGSGQQAPTTSAAAPPPPFQRVLTPATSTASTSPPPVAASVPASSSYANITSSASPPPKITLPFPPKKNGTAANGMAAKTKTAPVKPAWNPGARGLDDPINCSVTSMESIKVRKESNKLCNNHYLRGPCSRQKVCPFVHNYRPTKDEIQALAMLSRMNPCSKGQDCDVADCIYGHHCPSTNDGLCPHPYCKFPSNLHPPGTKFKNAHIQEN